jgi:hypothetical protein
MEMNILLEGRKLVRTEVIEQTPTKIITISEYDDGTVLKFHQEAGDIKVDCNKLLVIESDGTVKIRD